MKAFRYIARTGPEGRVEGVMEAESASGVSRALLAKGLFPIEVTEVAGAGRLLGKVGVFKTLWQRFQIFTVT